MFLNIIFPMTSAWKYTITMRKAKTGGFEKETSGF